MKSNEMELIELEGHDDDLFEEGDIQTTDLFALFIKQGLQQPLLKHEEFVALIKKAQNGCMNSRNQIIEANQRLVVNIAKNFPDKTLPMLDLVSEGNIGLIRAIEKFEVEKGFQFSTYATIWVKQSMQALVMNMKRTVRWPSHFIALNVKYNQIIAREKLKGKVPTPEEIKEELEINQQAFDLLTSTTSYMVNMDDAKHDGNDGNGLSIEDTIGDEATALSSDMISDIQRGNSIGEFMNLYLDKRTASVLKMRYGVGGYEMTLEQVSELYGLTKERIRQIEVKGLEKLKKMLVNRHELSSSFDI